MSKLDEAKIIVEKYHSDRETWRANKSQKMEEAQAAVNNAQARITANIQSGDYEAFQAAKKDLAEANDRLEYCRAQMEGTYIPEATFKDLVTGIHAEADAANATAATSLKSLLNQFVEIDDTLKATLTDMNNTLLDLETGSSKDPSGLPGSARLTNKDYFVIWYLNDVIEKAKTAGFLENN